MSEVSNFLFHRVSPERDRLWDPMDVKLFDRCIQYISSKYTVIKIEDFTEIDFSSVNQQYATISFDDGYKDNIVYAIPILNKYNVKASFYVVTNCIDQNIPTWTHVLEYVFQHTSKTEINLDFDFLPLELKHNHFRNLESKLKFAKSLKPVLKKNNHENRNKVLTQINLVFNDVVFPNIMMSWEDLKTIQLQGHSIGSHTISHCMLGTMENEEEIRNELKESKKIISYHLNTKVKTISYPVGSYNATTIMLSKEVGYEIGLAVKQDIYITERDSFFEIPRIELYNEPWWKTKLRINNKLELFKKIIRYK